MQDANMSTYMLMCDRCVQLHTLDLMYCCIDEEDFAVIRDSNVRVLKLSEVHTLRDDDFLFLVGSSITTFCFQDCQYEPCDLSEGFARFVASCKEVRVIPHT